MTLTRGSLSSVSHTGSLVTVALCPNTGGWSTGRERAAGHSGSALERTGEAAEVPSEERGSDTGRK